MVLIFYFAPKDFLAVGEILITYTVFQLSFFIFVRMLSLTLSKYLFYFQRQFISLTWIFNGSFFPSVLWNCLKFQKENQDVKLFFILEINTVLQGVPVCIHFSSGWIRFQQSSRKENIFIFVYLLQTSAAWCRTSLHLKLQHRVNS